MRVHVDPARCQGHALCAMTAPTVFVLDDDGYASSAHGDGPVAEEDESRASAAAANCPERAITATP